MSRLIEKLKLVDKQYIASLEQILLWNPDVILANQDGVGDYILESPAFHTLQAVKNQESVSASEWCLTLGAPGWFRNSPCHPVDGQNLVSR